MTGCSTKYATPQAALFGGNRHFGLPYQVASLSLQFAVVCHQLMTPQPPPPLPPAADDPVAAAKSAEGVVDISRDSDDGAACVTAIYLGDPRDAKGIAGGDDCMIVEDAAIISSPAARPSRERKKSEKALESARRSAPQRKGPASFRG